MEYIKNFTDYLVRQSWQVAILFLLVAVGSFLLRNKSSHWRYLLWCVILAKCLLPPVMTFKAAVLPADMTEFRHQKSEVSDKSKISNQNIQTRTNNQNSKLDSSLPSSLRFDATGRENDTGIGENNGKEIASSSRNATPRNDSGSWINQPIRLYVFFVWGIGAISFLIVAGVKAFLLNRWILRHRQLPGEDVSGEIEKLKNTVSSDFLGRIWVVEKITQPFVWGLWRGNAYLPAESKNSADVIMHELAHIIRLDAFVNLLQIFAQAIFWFHPFVWFANNKIRAEREKSCDEIAIARLKVSPRSYSSAVVDVLVREYQARRSLPSLAVAGPVKNIEERIRTIMAQGKKFYSRPTAAAVITVLVLAAICVPTTVAITKVGEPDLVIKGKVVDSATGKPIAGARVGDAERYNEGKFQTTTDANGDYSYKTWYEEHDVKSEADGYQRQDKGFGTKLFGSEKEKFINFELRPSFKTDAQIGTVEDSRKLLMERRDILQNTLQHVEMNYDAGRADSKQLGQAKIDLLRVEIELAETPQKRIEILSQIVTIYAEQEKLTKLFLDAGRATLEELNKVKLERLDAEEELAKAKAETKEQQNIDIYIEDFDIRPYEAGGLYTVTVKIGNHGTVDAPQFRLNFYKGNPADNLNLHGKPQTGYHGAGPIKAGDFWNECSSPFALEDGDNTLFVMLDTKNEVAEANENNNQTMLMIIVKDGKIIKKAAAKSATITREADGQTEMILKGARLEDNGSLTVADVIKVRTTAEQDANGIAEKQRLQNLVEDFFKNNYRDITARKTIEWGEPIVDANGNMSIRYKYEATIWDKDKIITNQLFVFDKDGKVISFNKIEDDIKLTSLNFDELLSQNVTVDIDKSPDGSGLTIQYAVMAVCEAAGVPYKWDTSAKLAEPQRLSFIKPLHIKDKIARDAITDILKPVGLDYAVGGDGLFIYKK